MGQFVIQVDLPWIFCSLRLVIMISKLYPFSYSNSTTVFSIAFFYLVSFEY